MEDITFPYSAIDNSNSDWSRGYPPSTTATPSRRGPQPFNEQFQNHNTPSATPRLPCEFDVLTGCRERFLADETSQWIDHVSSHFRGKFPEECWCWYCDDFKFNAEAMGLDRKLNFHHRLEHIREHLVDGNRLRTRRRDYPLLKFLDKNKLIPSSVAKLQLSTRESPSFPGEEEEARAQARDKHSKTAVEKSQQAQATHQDLQQQMPSHSRAQVVAFNSKDRGRNHIEIKDTWRPRSTGQNDLKYLGLSQALPVTVLDSTGQNEPPGMTPRVTSVFWEDEGVQCFQVESQNICVARREDDNMINGTRLLAVSGMSMRTTNQFSKAKRLDVLSKLDPRI